VSLIVDEHREYLSDSRRVEAFRHAITEVVTPGAVVVDLGAGTGIMGLLACRAGAGRVYAIESTDLIGLTEDLCRANGCEDRVRFLKEDSTRVTLPEPADLVIADQIGHFGFEAGVLEYFGDAARRFLKPGGILLPSRIDLCVAPISHKPLWEQVEFWNRTPAGFDCRPARTLAVNTGYPFKFAPEQVVGQPALLASLDTAKSPTVLSGLEVWLTADRDAPLHGIGGWFVAQLSPRVTMTNSPLDAGAIGRRNVYFPIDRPVEMAQGDQINVAMQIRLQDVMVNWAVEVWDQNRSRMKARSVHSTFHGMLLCKEQLHRTRPDFVPRLTARGEARRTILELIDGRHALREIEGEVYRRHQDLFASPAEAATFVAEVTTRYTT
jgi:protein arginine N-methyltransferase 1